VTDGFDSTVLIFRETGRKLMSNQLKINQKRIFLKTSFRRVSYDREKRKRKNIKCRQVRTSHKNTGELVMFTIVYLNVYVPRGPSIGQLCFSRSPALLGFVFVVCGGLCSQLHQWVSVALPSGVV